MCDSTSLLTDVIILDKNNFVRLSHHCMSLNVGTSIWGNYFRENIPEGSTGPHNKSSCLNKYVSIRNCDHELFRTTNAFILCDLFSKVQKGDTVNREEHSKRWGLLKTS